MPGGLGHAALLGHRLEYVQIAQFDAATDAIRPVHTCPSGKSIAIQLYPPPTLELCKFEEVAHGLATTKLEARMMTGSLTATLAVGMAIFAASTGTAAEIRVSSIPFKGPLDQIASQF